MVYHNQNKFCVLEVVILILKVFYAGVDKWPGKQIHSHNYRVPKPYEDLVSHEA